MKSYMAKQGEIEAKWHVVDVTDKILGRVATKIARVLMGKHRPEYTPNVDTGDFVVVTNASSIRVTGVNKPDQRQFKSYSGYPGGLHETSLREMLEKDPERVIREAVRRMLPKTRLGTKMLQKLKVYPGADHPHSAQQPEPLEL